MPIEEKGYSHEIEKNLADDHGRILIVDDDNLVLTALEMTLQREGYEVFTSQDGYKAVETLKKISPALIICDQTMPGMSGIEVMQQAQEIRPDAIRILLTASQDTETAINAINIGQVNQYLTKPWKDALLRKTVQTSLEKYKLVKENRVLQELIFNQHKKLIKNHDSLCHDLKLGGRIHEKLLLGKVPRNIPGFMIDALSCPSQEIDGDFFEFYAPSPQNLDLVFGDVMGKGIAAALVGNAVKTQMIRFAMPFPYTQIFDKQLGWYSNILAPEEILSHVHAEIAKPLIDLEYFVALFYGRFDLQYKTFTFIDCGSTKPLHFKAKDKTTVQLNGSNFPLGFVENANYQPVETSFSEGDIFLFYSDGVTEARSPSNGFFGVDRLTNLVESNND
ncbi:MAG: PP2C family protein-serine/threonine phosphatase, partial [Waddliaceae bacterium]